MEKVNGSKKKKKRKKAFEMQKLKSKRENRLGIGEIRFFLRNKTGKRKTEI